jgi:hypothetical protein
MMEIEEPDREFVADNDLTPFDIVELLKSPDGNERAKALDWLYPGEPVALVMHYPKSAQHGLATTKSAHLAGLFTALCFSCQQIGKALGMHLDWVKKRDDQKIVVVTGGGLAPPRGKQ